MGEHQAADRDWLTASEANALQADNDRLRAAITTAVEELRAEHRAAWASDEMKARANDPLLVGCAYCWPKDGGWPCASRMVADDLAAAVGGEHG